jgi:hypothetical protein
MGFNPGHVYGNFFACDGEPRAAMVPYVKEFAAEVLPAGTRFDVYTTAQKVRIGELPTGRTIVGYPLCWRYPAMPKGNFRLIERCTV